MQKSILIMLLFTFGFSTFHCSEQETVTSLSGSSEIRSSSDTVFAVGTDTLMVLDSVVWLYNFPLGSPSSVSVIVTGKTQVDIDIETYVDNKAGRISLGIDSFNVFADTVPIARSPLSNVLLIQNSRLFLRNGDQVLDTIELINPRSPETIAK